MITVSLILKNSLEILVENFHLSELRKTALVRINYMSYFFIFVFFFYLFYSILCPSYIKRTVNTKG